MKKELSIVLLLIMILLCCACASKDAAAPEACDISTEAALNNYAYSMERSANPAEEMPDLASFEQEPLTYVIFNQHSGSFSAEDGTKLFISRSNVPEIMTEDAAVNTWLASAVADAAKETTSHMHAVEQWAKEDHQNRAEDDQLGFYTYSYYTDISIERLDNRVISALQTDSVNSGGAHPNYVQKACNLDLTEQKQLSLSDVILPESAALLRQRVLDQLEKQFGGLESSGLYADYPEIVASYFADPNLTPYWYFSSNGLVIYFNCYDIAAYAAGIIKVELLYDGLDDVLKPAYFPEDIEITEGNIVPLSTAEGRNLLTIPAEGEWLYLGTNQTVYDIKLYRLTGWITDDVPIVGQMAFAANRLTALDAVAIPSTDDAGYLLTYRSGAGHLRKMAINASEVREIVIETAE